MRILFFLYIAFAGFNLYGQHTVSGSFSGLGGQTIRLVGFNGFGIYTIDSIKASVNGAFSMSYGEADFGMAYLAGPDNKSFILVLGNEKMQVSGESFAIPASVRVESSRENEWFGRYATEHPRREQALSAWDYLLKIYQHDSLFSVVNRPKKEIERERNRIKEEDASFLKNLNPGSYVSWYLPVRKLVSSVGTIAQYRTEELPATIEAFRKLDYTDARMYKSGLLRDALEAHVWLIENSGRPLDSVYVELNTSIDRMMPYLITDEKKFNEITDYLFKLLEKRSLFGSSEYLALKVLNEQSCTLTNDLAAQLESYRAMKKGNVAPDIELESAKTFFGSLSSNAGSQSSNAGSQSSIAGSQSSNAGSQVSGAGSTGNISPQTPSNLGSTGNIPSHTSSYPDITRLSNLRSRYSLIVFGASWCPACQAELAQLAGFYPNWKKQGVEVVFVSLDDQPDEFRKFAVNFPFISTCDFKKWESPTVKNYHVFATPTLFLLDADRKIVLRPNSARQVDSWVDWFLVQGNLAK